MEGQTKESGESSLRRILMGTFLHEISKRIVRIVPGLSGLLGKETLKISSNQIGMQQPNLRVRSKMQGTHM